MYIKLTIRSYLLLFFLRSANYVLVLRTQGGGGGGLTALLILIFALYQFDLDIYYNFCLFWVSFIYQEWCVVVLQLADKKNKLVEFENAFVRENLNNKNLSVPKAKYSFKQELRAHMALVTRQEELRTKSSYGMSSNKILRINWLI